MIGVLNKFKISLFSWVLTLTCREYRGPDRRLCLGDAVKDDDLLRWSSAGSEVNADALRLFIVVALSLISKGHVNITLHHHSKNTV